ncbi:Salicylaldehyde dehydrogenase [Hypsizygus marmoreus]|uniref:Salicylaldehyde dehydrogenase n=1 Tax=Hypsizygus marmoreus TaxID=39966 RepID=A0A369K364_HYPMA|nr:Salicylaldehyde dehydrogenase [Hypsizygus marmoreus]
MASLQVSPTPVFTPLFIDGELKSSSTSSTFQVVNPYTNEVVGLCSSASSEDCRDAIEAASSAFHSWEISSLAKRRDIFLKAADIVSSDRYRTKIIDAMTAETAATQSFGVYNWGPAATILRTTAGLVNELRGETFPSISGGHVMVQRRATGVILGIAPWNAPFTLALRAVAIPLICGNTVVLKSSENSPRTHALVVELFQEAGLPKGVLNFISMSRESSPRLTAEMIAHPMVRKINFTGSDRVGRLLAAEAAKYLKPCILELGGKSPMVVLDDANLEDAARAIVYGAMAHSGQICMSTERVIVQRGISKALISAVITLCEPLKAGDPSKNLLSPLFSVGSAENVLDLIRDALDAGAELLLGDLSRKGSIVQPHLLYDVKPDMRIWEHETFGPVTLFSVFDTIDEAVDLANASDYTLAASLFTTNLHSAMEISPRIRSGYINVNGTTFHSEPLLTVFGLGGSSGYGRFDVEHFTDKRSIVFHPPQRQYSLLGNLKSKL